MRDVKLVVTLFLLGCLVLFTVQNVELLQVHFLFWTLEIRRAFLLFIVLAIGVLVGWWLHAHLNARQARERDRRDDESRPV